MTCVRTPSIIIAGVQKCGTTALYDSLCMHPMIEGPSRILPESSPFAPKELHYFNTSSLRKLGWCWYLSHFSTNRTLKIEATPEYAASRNAIREMALRLPAAKIILVFRDPLDRLCSAWNHWRNLLPENRWPVPVAGGTLAENLNAELGALMEGSGSLGLFGRGLYDQTLRMVRRYFPDEQIATLFLEDLVARPRQELRRLQKWIGVRPMDLPFPQANSARRKLQLPPMQVLAGIWPVYRHANRCLEAMIGRRGPWARKWDTWLSDRSTKSFEPDVDACELSRTAVLMRACSLAAEHGPALFRRLKALGFDFGEAGQRKILAAAYSRGGAGRAGRAIVRDADLKPHERVSAAKAFLQNGGKMGSVETRELLTLIGDEKQKLLEAFLRSGLEEDAAKYWTMT